jgi:hypothetical protein
MGLTSQPEQVLDQRFFHMTGLAMVLGTVVAGAITIWLANDRMSQPSLHTLHITKVSGRPTSALQEPPTIAGAVAELPFSIHANEMVSNSR